MRGNPPHLLLKPKGRLNLGTRTLFLLQYRGSCPQPYCLPAKRCSVFFDVLVGEGKLGDFQGYDRPSGHWSAVASGGVKMTGVPVKR